MAKRWLAIIMITLLVSVTTIGFTQLAAADAALQTGAWTANYFNNPNLQGAPVATGVLPPGGINMNWGTNPPDPAVPATNWSARFTSVQQFAPGSYEFFLTSDDGSRLFIDGVLVVDQFIGQVATTRSFSVTLTAGAHTLVVEYFNGIDQAILQLNWIGTSPITTATPFGWPTATFGPTPTSTRIPPTGLPAIPPGAMTATVVRASVLLARSGPFIGAPVVGRLQRGQTYAVIGRDANAQWFLLQLSGFQGWAWGYYLFINGNEFNAPIVGPFTTAGEPSASTGIVVQSQAGIRLRAAPTVASEQIGRIGWGEILPVLGRTADGGWYQTNFKGTIGWIAASLVRSIEGDPMAAPVTG
ncbi:MAG: SH3 domain-containing protein [Anaerolineae bacterium]|nr:SH3 domain-containing protein [Anaerolineae bacterium]